MKRWPHRVLLVAVPLALIAAGLYEAATHVGRGWLRGEAFYDGRPTSYWRGQIDEWVERFDSAEVALMSLEMVVISTKTDSAGFLSGHGPPTPRLRPETWTTRFVKSIGGSADADEERRPPTILWGWHGSDAVLPALAQEANYRAFAERAMRNVKRVRAIEDAGRQPALLFYDGKRPGTIIW